MVLILTRTFPHDGGEQFLESEVSSWIGPCRVVFAPSEATGSPRQVPPDVTVDLSISRRSHTSRQRTPAESKKQLRGLLRAELSEILRRPSRWHLALYTVKSYVRTRQVFRGLHQLVARHGTPDLVYCYWNDVEAYAAVLAKRSGWLAPVVTRAHSFDVYSERRWGGYSPFKAQLIDDFDAVLPISTHARDYLRSRYGPGAAHEVHRLGVRIPPRPARTSPPGELRLLSLSSCVPVKRLDRVIDGLATAAAARPEVEFHWTHIGAGPLREALESQAIAKLDSLPNVRHRFLGSLANDEVHEFLSTEPVDVLVNASAYEGIAVSAMEAMSYGVPVIAPDVGGMGELVSADNGWLISSRAEIAEISETIIVSASQAKDPLLRERARALVVELYRADRNYPIFVRACLARIGVANVLDSPGEDTT